jgi:hypothetical protein
VIARLEQAAGFRKRLAADSTVALFSGAEALKALDAVLCQAPRILALDRAFAATRAERRFPRKRSASR